ncbi:MAG: DUF4968 domain-containing protein, partial [Muribaculaceae bacterium]|nr:DUF4968 domain-containing protein [Muribaculaceae bacterium]
MKKTAILTIFAIAAALTGGRAANVRDTGHGVAIDTDSLRIELQFFTSGTVRVVKTPAGQAAPAPGFAITARPDSSVRYKTSSSARHCRVAASGVRADIDLRTGLVSFADGRGRSMLREAGAPVFGETDELGRKAMTAEQSFALGKDEAIYGLGNLSNGQLSQRGVSRTLMPSNIDDGIPVIHSVKGYALYWDNYSPTYFGDSDGIAKFYSAPADAVDYYFMCGNGSSDAVIAEMRAISGHVPMMPLWTYGFWQSRERYKSQDETCGVVARYRKAGVRLDGIIQDWQYWGNNYLWNAMEFMNP